MKLHTKYTSIFLIMMGAILISSCQEDDAFDFSGQASEVIYLQTPNHTVKGYDKIAVNVSKSPAGVILSEPDTIYVYATLPVGNVIEGDITVDESLAAAYCEQHNMEYHPIPKNVPLIKNSHFQIDKGSKKSVEGFSVQVNKEAVANLPAGTYIMPLVIGTVTGAPCSTNRNVLYCTLSIVEDTDNIWDGGVVKGSRKAGDHSAWTISVSPEPQYQGTNRAAIFDGQEPTGWGANWYCYIGAATEFIVDMQSIQTDISGIYFNSSPANTTYYYSTDNVNWIELGVPTTTNKEIVFYAPISARYIKFISLDSGSWTKIDIVEFDIFTL